MFLWNQKESNRWTKVIGEPNPTCRMNENESKIFSFQVKNQYEKEFWNLPLNVRHAILRSYGLADVIDCKKVSFSDRANHWQISVDQFNDLPTTSAITKIYEVKWLSYHKELNLTHDKIKFLFCSLIYLCTCLGTGSIILQIFFVVHVWLPRPTSHVPHHRY